MLIRAHRVHSVSFGHPPSGLLESTKYHRFHLCGTVCVGSRENPWACRPWTHVGRECRRQSSFHETRLLPVTAEGRVVKMKSSRLNDKVLRFLFLVCLFFFLERIILSIIQVILVTVDL